MSATKFILLIQCVVFLLCMAVFMSEHALARNDLIDFDIAAQPLATALDSLAAQGGVQILLAEETVRGKQSQGLHGVFTVREALAELLKGSDLDFTFTTNDTVAVVAAGPLPAAPLAARGQKASPPDSSSTAQRLPDLFIVGGGIARGFQETLHEQAGAIHSLSGDDIERSDSRTTLDLIRRIPGVTAENYNQQGVAAAYSFRAFRLGHGIGAGSYLDGIPYNEINNPEGDGYPDYNTVLPESIERLEILKGLFSPRFGAYAQAGVLHFITKDRGDYSRLKLQFGSWNYRRGVLEVARESDRFFTYNAIATDQGDGYRDSSDFHGGNIFSRFGYKPNEDSTVRLTVHSYRTQWNAPGPLSQADWDGNNLKRRTTDGGGYRRKNMLSVDYALRLNPSSEISALAYGYASEYARWTAASNVERFDDRSTFGARATYFRSDDFSLFTNDFLVGLDYENIDSRGRSWNAVHPMTRERADPTLSGDFDFSNVSVYVQNDIKPSSLIKFTLGGRYEIFDGNLDNNLTGNRGAYFEKIFNPKGGVLVTPLEGLEFFGNIGSGYILPIGFLRFENPAVDHARLISYDVGTRYQPVPEALLQLSLYRTKVTDEIIVDPVTLLETNAGKSRRQGIEVSAAWYRGRNTLIYFSGATQDSRFMDWDTSAGDFTGNKIPRVPEVIANAGLEYLPDLGFGGSFSVSHTGRRWNDNANTIEEASYTIVNASIRYTVPKVTFTLFLNNLTDEKYSELRGATEYYPADPFNVTFTTSVVLGQPGAR